MLPLVVYGSIESPPVSALHFGQVQTGGHRCQCHWSSDAYEIQESWCKLNVGHENQFLMNLHSLQSTYVSCRYSGDAA